MEFNKSNQEIIKAWSDGEVVWSAELGGIGPQYEYCIQYLLFEIFSAWDPLKPMPHTEDESYPEEYSKLADKVAQDLDKSFHFSGAQVGQAKATAFQFIKYGYSHMMNKLSEDRLIQVSNNFLGKAEE